MRNFPASPSLIHKSSTTPPKVELIIVCEGANTEPKYFEECTKYYGAGMVSLRLITAAGVPLTLVKCAIYEREKLLIQRRRSKNSYDSCFRVWAVFDRDQHPNIKDALGLAAAFNIDVAFSNPCFELWPILHLEDFGAQMGRHDLQAHLRDLMPNYSHKSGAVIDFPLIRNNFIDAYKRAQKHNDARAAEGCAYGPPSTTVNKLVRKIIENGKTGNMGLIKILNQLPPN